MTDLSRAKPQNATPEDTTPEDTMPEDTMPENTARNDMARNAPAGVRAIPVTLPFLARAGAGAFALLVLSGASPFAFAPAPQADLNRIYRVNTATGEVGACQYGLKEGTIGVTFCFPAGEGAGPQTLGHYGLVSSNHVRESGVFRINYRTGEISSCYVFNTQVVCTPQLSATETPASPGSPAREETRSQPETTGGDGGDQPPTTPAD